MYRSSQEVPKVLRVPREVASLLNEGVCVTVGLEKVPEFPKVPKVPKVPKHRRRSGACPTAKGFEKCQKCQQCRRGRDFAQLELTLRVGITQSQQCPGPPFAFTIQPSGEEGEVT